ncbi:MAG TPA: hypothetical protein PKD85_19905 [Saprospiraceae bacterium]|nr:hypothetical protein [Saprospiraceae bacterium]
MKKIKKGYFVTKNSEVIKLLQDTLSDRYILFIKTDGKKIYFTSKNEATDVVYQKLKAAYPSL